MGTARDEARNGLLLDALGETSGSQCRGLACQTTESVGTASEVQNETMGSIAAW
jgi:hypothetical protein